jgi:hypothetical protein
MFTWMPLPAACTITAYVVCIHIACKQPAGLCRVVHYSRLTPRLALVAAVVSLRKVSPNRHEAITQQ